MDILLMQSFILNFWHSLIRQSWRYEIFILLTQFHHWPKMSKLLHLGTHGAGFLHDIGNTTMIIRFLHADFAHQLTNRQNRELTAQLEHLSNLIIEGQSILAEQSLSIDAFDVRECLNECVQLFQNHPLGKDCSIKIQGCRAIDLYGPSTILTQAILNILLNSAQALKNQRKKKITITLTKNAFHYTVTILDNGPGFPQQYSVQPFHTTKAEGNGIGLWYSLFQLKKHFACTSSCRNDPSGGAQTKLYFWKPQ